MTRHSRSNESSPDRRACRTDGYSTASTRVVLAVAAETDTDVDALPTLYDAIDPEALDRLVEGSSDRAVTVTFEYHDRRVTVSGDGSIDVEPL